MKHIYVKIHTKIQITGRGNVRITVTLRRVRVTTAALEKQ